MNPVDATFSGGFSAPVPAAQSVFRTLMEAMARPARVVTVACETAVAPAPAGALIAALALTLADHDTPVHLSPALAASAFPHWLAFHTGAPLAASRLDATFAFCALADGLPPLEGFALGSDLYPDRSVTVIAELPSLTGGPRLAAKGPGIRDTARLAPAGLPDGFLAERALNRSLFPRGIDLVLVSGDALLCLPRTTRLSAEEC